MNEQVIELFGSLILTFLGFISPILVLLLSLFPEGVKVLTEKYKNKKKQSDENITEEIKKRDSGKDLDYKALAKTLKTLQRNKKNAEIKLSYLNPTKQIIRISIPFIIAFIGIVVVLSVSNWRIILFAMGISLLSFFYALYIMWNVLCVLIEVTEVVSDSTKARNDRTIELLSALVEKSGVENLFLGSENIIIKFNNKILSEKSEFKFSINKKYKIPISIINNDEKMAKMVEIGFIFPLFFLIEKTTNISSIYTEEKEQIVRLEDNLIYQNERKNQGNLSITFLKAGRKEIKAFIKGENIKSKYIKFFIECIE